MAPLNIHLLPNISPRQDPGYDFVSGEPPNTDTDTPQNGVKGSVVALVVVVVAVFLLLSISCFCIHGRAQQKRKELQMKMSANPTPSASGIFRAAPQQQQGDPPAYGNADDRMGIAGVEPAQDLENGRSDARSLGGQIRGSQVGVAV